MKTSAVLLVTAGAASAQLASDINSISAAVVSLNGAVSAFSAAPQASAIVEQSGNIVSLINKAAADAKSGGQITVNDATGLLTPFQGLQGAVESVVDNLVSRKAVATSLSLGNVVEAQLVSQLNAAQAFASAVQAQLPAALAPVGTSLAGAILSDLSSGSAAFSGLSGPSTLGGSSPATSSASATGSSSSASSSAATSGATSSASATGSASSTSTAVGGSSPSSNVTTGTAPSTPTTTVIPGSGADKTVVSFFGIVAAAFIGMIAL